MELHITVQHTFLIINCNKNKEQKLIIFILEGHGFYNIIKLI